MTVEIKILRRGDEAALANVAEGVFDHPIDPAAGPAFLADPRHHLAVAIEGGTVVGFASGVHYFHPDKPGAELFVNEVGVSPQHHRRGIATSVLQALLEHGRELGCREAWVLTNRSNKPAMGLYSRAGGMAAAADEVMFSFELSASD